MNASADARVLIVDDEPDIRWALSTILREGGLKSLDASDGTAALSLLDSACPDLMLLDLRMPGMDGMEVLREAKRLHSDLSIIVLTAYGTIRLAVEAVKSGAYDFLTKPFKNEEILLTVRRALREGNLKRESEGHFRELACETGPSEQLSSTRETEATAQLAVGIAHHFNNLLTAIMGFGGLVRDAISENDPVQKDVEAILKAGRRATALTRQLLAFSRRQALRPRCLDLNRLVAGAQGMLGRLIGEDIELIIALRRISAL